MNNHMEAAAKAAAPIFPFSNPAIREQQAEHAIIAALPHLRAMIAEEIRAEMPPLRARQSGQTMRACLEYAAQIAERKR